MSETTTADDRTEPDYDRSRLSRIREGDTITFTTAAPGVGCAVHDITGEVTSVETDQRSAGPILDAHVKTTVTVRADAAQRLRADHPSVRRGTAGTDTYELTQVTEVDSDYGHIQVVRTGTMGGDVSNGNAVRVEVDG